MSFCLPSFAVFTRWLLCLALAFAACAGSAQTPPADVSSGTTPDATLDSVRKQIDAVQVALTTSPDDTELLRLRSAALTAQTQSAGLATDLAQQLGSVEARLAELGTLAPGTKEAADIASQRAQLTKGRNALDAQVKLARLLGVEGGQLAAQLWALRRSQFQARLGERTNSILAAPFWSELREDLPHDSASLAALGREIGSAARATPTPVWLGLPLALAALWALLWWARRGAVHWITTRVTPGRLRRSLYALTVLLQFTLAVGVPGSALHAAINWNHTLAADTDALLGSLFGMLWFGGYIAGLVTALVSATRPSWRLPALPDEVADRLRWFAPQLAVVSTSVWLAERLATFLNASLAVAVAVNCVVALALALTVALALMRAEHAWHLALGSSNTGANTGANGGPNGKVHFGARPIWRVLAAGFNWLVLAGAIVCLLAGYVAFGSFAVKQVVWACIVLGSAYLLAALIDDGLSAWAGAAPPDGHAAPPPPGHAASPASSAASTSKALAQAAVLASGALRLAVLMVALMLLLAPFGEGPADLLRRGGQWQQGLAIGEIKLLPGAVLQALAVLLIGLLAVRVLRVWLAERYLPTTALDAGMRNSTTSLIHYAGVVLVVALAMSALGIGLERVAWVASALSVGIGFGLQAVVQNFVSGLILLAERPVKVGDWVSLGGVEGDIRRINVRATEIQMGDRSTVIVPNSEFITKVVRNVTLADPLGLVQLKLPVPLGTDPQQVRELLLQAFDAEPDVLDTPAPAVLLDGIDNGQLMFNATGFVNSPRMVGGVRSALLFEVLTRLKAAGITLSKPPTMLMSVPATAQESAAETALVPAAAQPLPIAPAP